MFLTLLFIVSISVSRGLSGRPLDPFGGHLTSKVMGIAEKNNSFLANEVNLLPKGR